MAMHDYEIVDQSFFATAPARFVSEIETMATPEQVFDSFENEEDWVAWAPPIKKVEWTSPKPFGVGTTRTVTMTGNMVGEEVFIAWERGKRMAFCFERASTNALTVFAEDYHVVPTDEGCRVKWIVGMQPRGLHRHTLPLMVPLQRAIFQWMFNRFKRLLDTEYAAGAARAA